RTTGSAPKRPAPWRRKSAARCSAGRSSSTETGERRDRQPPVEQESNQREHCGMDQPHPQPGGNALLGNPRLLNAEQIVIDRVEQRGEDEVERASRPRVDERKRNRHQREDECTRRYSHAP